MNKSYWHFCALDDNGNPVMRDGTIVEIGKRYEIDGEIELCARGYHGSSRALDALQYAPGPWVSLRPLENVIDGEDKSVGQAFVQQHGFDATPILRKFARWCALQIVDNCEVPAVVRRYLETGEESLRIEAWEVAQAAARVVAWAAERDIAQAAARVAAWAAERDIAQAAAWEAARDTAQNAAWAAARAAAWGTAQDAAWAAERDKQNTQLESMLMAALQEDNDE